MNFRLIKTSKKSQARLGILKTAHGAIHTPFFMPIATRGSVKALRSADLKKIGAKIILANSYHLFFKPGLKVLKKAGGLNSLMAWPCPVLTDSGGYQIFSLARRKFSNSGGNAGYKNLVKIKDNGVEFRSVYDGSKHLFTPKKVLEIQEAIGSDIRMVLDVCSQSKCSREQAEKDLEITLRWAEESFKINNSKSKIYNPKFLLFGIAQGALYKDLRLKCVEALCKMNFDGYALGGLAVGETPEEMYKVLDYTVPSMPQNKPHYLMGVGYPEQIIEAVKRGIDMFDCVIPTREARHGRLYVFNQKFGIRDFYNTINITSAKFANDFSPINPNSKLQELRNYTKAYLRHLFSVSEPLALQIATFNNVEFYLDLMEKIRKAIRRNAL